MLLGPIFIEQSPFFFPLSHSVGQVLIVIVRPASTVSWLSAKNLVTVIFVFASEYSGENNSFRCQVQNC